MYLKETDSRETWLSGDSGTGWTYLCEEKRERGDKECEIPEGSSGRRDKGDGHVHLPHMCLGEYAEDLLFHTSRNLF